VNDRHATLMHLTLLAFMLALYFGASPASSARFAMWFTCGQAATHGLFWWLRRERV
jgi:hypothetical protein